MTSMKSRLQAGKVQRGLWLGLGSAAGAEIAATAGLDWCLIDGEHGPYDIASIAEQARILGPLGMADTGFEAKARRVGGGSKRSWLI